MSWLNWDWLFHVEFREPLLLYLSPFALVAIALARLGRGTLRFSSLRLLPGHDNPTSPRGFHTWRTRLDVLPDGLIGLATLLLVFALAGPRTTDARSRIRKEGIAIMMVVDISSSMRALDLSEKDKEQTRLDAVKVVFEDFVTGDSELSGRPNDAIGLVSFARNADTSSPLTLDHARLLTIVDRVKIVEKRKEDGTAIGDGLGLAVERLRRSKAKSRVAILLTDGVNNRGEESPIGAAQLAKAVGVKVYTIGAGTNGLAPVKATDPFSGRTVLRQVPVEIDEQTLRAIAEETGGRYFRATDSAALHEVYAEIDRLERTELGEDRYRQYNEHFQPIVAAAILLALLAWLLRASALRRAPC